MDEQTRQVLERIDTCTPYERIKILEHLDESETRSNKIFENAYKQYEQVMAFANKPVVNFETFKHAVWDIYYKDSPPEIWVRLFSELVKL